MTTQACESWKSLLAGYLYEDLDPSSRAAVEAHLGECASCREALEAMREASETLDAWKVPARGTRRRTTAPRRSLPLIAAAAAVLFAAAIFFSVKSSPPPPAATPTVRRPDPKLELPKPAIPPRVEEKPAPPVPPLPPVPKPETPRAPDLVPPAPAPPAQPDPVTPPARAPQKEVPPPTRPVPAVVAQLEWVHGQVHAGTVAKAKVGVKILSGESIETVGPASLAIVRLADGTRLELEAGTQIATAPEKIDLLRGALTADVAKQPAGRALAFVTPHAEARVLGTRLRLSIEAEGTRLEVREGKVRFKRSKDEATADVSAGTFSVTNAPRLTPRALREVSFQDGVSPIPAYAGTRDTFLSQQNPAHPYGTKKDLQVDGNNPTGTGNDLNLLVRWDLSAIPRGSRVQSVVIELRSQGPTNVPFNVYAVRRAWTEEEATWMQPWQEFGASGTRDRGTAPVGVIAPLGPDLHVLRLNAEGVTLVQSWIDAPDSNHGLIIPGGEISNGLQVHSRESQDGLRRPRVTVTYLPK